MGIIGRERKVSIMNYIEHFESQNGYTPTVREICKGVGLRSTASVNEYLKELETAGYIKRSPDKSRTIEIVGSKRGELVRYNTSQIPHLKSISGNSILGKDNIRSYFSIPADFAPTEGELFAVSAPDDSMSGAGIMQGDTVFASGCESINNGDRVVCLKGITMLIREIYLEGTNVRLHPLNNLYEDIVVSQCQVVGKIFGVFRIYTEG